MSGTYDTIIIGSGVAGMSAAMYAGRLKLRTTVIGEVKGGTIILTNDIRNWPGIKVTDGMALSRQIEEHALEYGINFVQDRVLSVRPQAGGYAVSTGSGTYEAKTIILATGTEVRKLGVPGEKELAGMGVHYCALCDGFLYKDKVVAVIGGSDSAAKGALMLTQWARKVFVIYRGKEIRAEPFNLDALRKSKIIEAITETNVLEILGKESVDGVKLDKPHNGKAVLPLDAVFVEIGHLPVSGLAKQLGLKLNEKGEIIINRSCETSLPGVFAAGDVADDRFKQAIVGAAEGVIAAYGAYEYVTKKG